MGKGDKKSKRGKIILGSYGVRRKKNAKKSLSAVKPSPVEKVKVEVKQEKPKVKEVKEIKEVKPEKVKTETKKLETIAKEEPGSKPKAKKTAESTKKQKEE